jgi:phenylacetate-CoA ligase
MNFYDSLETRSHAKREADLMAALPTQIANAQKNSNAFANILKNVNPSQINTRKALTALPVTRKHDLLHLQEATRAANPAQSHVFGGFNTQSFGAAMPRVFASPGPIYEPEGKAHDYWRMARAIYAAGFCAGDLIHNCFSYHFVPAGSMMESGAHAVGCTVFPGGTGQTEQQVQAIQHLQPAGYIGTPSFLKIIIEKATELNQALPASFNKAMLGGEAFPPSLRDWLLERGIAGYQCYATADLGLIAYETEAREGLILDEHVILEIVRPGTGDPISVGEVGEVVVTSLNPDYPLIRFGTGDLSAVLTGNCPTGRTNTRIKGWMGRADQTTKMRGMFVHPRQVDAVVKRFSEIKRARLIVSGEMADDQVLFKVEVSSKPEGISGRIAVAVREITKLRADIELYAVGTLPNDGKVIEDSRSYK